MKRKPASSYNIPFRNISLGPQGKQSVLAKQSRILDPILERASQSGKKIAKTASFQIQDIHEQVTSSSWIIFDVSANKTYGHRVNSEKQIASLTKIMTCIIVLELIEKYKLDKDVKVKVDKMSAGFGGTSANLVEDYWLNVQDLIYGLMLPSGNDAAWLLAQAFGLLIFYEKFKPEDTLYQDIESIDLSTYESTDHFIARFLKVMNRKAKTLNMVNTSFTNPHGLINSSNYSSAKDLALLCKYCLQNEKFVQIINTREYIATVRINEEQCELEWKNTNKLLEQGWNGIKTGQTLSAGACLASFKEGVIIVVLNSSTIDKRFQDTTKIYDYYKNWKDSSRSH